MDLCIGQIVYSKRGRDAGNAFVVLKLTDDGAFIADGKLRTLAKPKRKKRKHLCPTNSRAEALTAKMERKEPLLDADLRKALAASGMQGRNRSIESEELKL